MPRRLSVITDGAFNIATEEAQVSFAVYSSEKLHGTFWDLQCGDLFFKEIKADIAMLPKKKDPMVAEIAAVFSAMAFLFNEELLNPSVVIVLYCDNESTVQQILKGFPGRERNPALALLDTKTRELFASIESCTGFKKDRQLITVHVPGAWVKKSVIGH